MTNKQTWLGICITCMLLLPGIMQAQNRLQLSSSHTGVDLAAQDKEQWMHLFPADDLPSFGFNNADELKNAQLGSPIEVFHMYRSEDGKPAMNQPDQFLIPLIYNNEARVFITVAFFEGRYQVVSAGEMKLANDASPVIMQHFSSRTKLVWLKQLNYQADFISAGDPSSQDLYYPLFTAKRALINEPATYSALKNIFKRCLYQLTNLKNQRA